MINKFRSNITLEEIEEILNVLNKTNISVCINTVVNLNNFLYLKEIFEIIKNFNCIKKWQLFQFSPIGEIAYKNKRKFEITKQIFDMATQNLMCMDSKISIEPKSNEFRKKKYILVNSDGQVWTPMYSNAREFTAEDEGTGKIIFGYVKNKEELWLALDEYLLKLQ